MSEQQYLDKATLAGGCFWCMQPPFDALDGVVTCISGYAGGDEQDATYAQVSSGQTKHAEVIQVTYDRRKLSFMDILDVFWRQIDPTTANRQFVDAGPQYRTAIFYHNEEQRELGEQSKRELDNTGIYSSPIVTEVTALDKFYPAEDYHQDYYQHNPERYQLYHHHSGREQYLEKVWGKKK